MANQHFGNLGDIWKHLPVAEMLRIVKPARYWESHSGSASYRLTHSPARDFGVYHFLDQAGQSSVLSESAYLGLLRKVADIEGESTPSPVYPGSAFVAMRVLREHSTRHLFCDIDGKSLGTIAEAADSLHISEGIVECIAGDGIGTIMRRLDALFDEKAAGAFLLVDPFHITAANEDGHDSLDLFAAAAKRGVMTALWYCGRTQQESEAVRTNIASSLRAHAIDEASLWRGEVELAAMNEPGFEAPGVGMCGLLCANLPDQAVNIAKRQGEAVASIYENAILPCGLSGRLQFNEICAVVA